MYLVCPGISLNQLKYLYFNILLPYFRGLKQEHIRYFCKTHFLGQQISPPRKKIIQKT